MRKKKLPTQSKKHKSYYKESLLLLTLGGLPSILITFPFISRDSYLKYILTSLIILVLCFISLLTGWKAKYNFDQSNTDVALKYAKRARIWFYVSLTFTFMTTYYYLTFPPLSVHYNPKANLSLEELIDAQESYREKYGTYTSDLSELNYDLGNFIIIKIDYADKEIWQGTSHFEGGDIIFMYDSRKKNIETIEGAEAHYQLAYMYYEGRGVEKDIEQAFKLFMKAAEQGDADAQMFLGIRFLQGKGVPQNYSSAHEWFSKAVEQGVEKAQLYLDAVCFKEPDVCN